MKISISIERPEWDPHPEKTTTNNWAWRKCVIVRFQNQSFRWIPTYNDLDDIKKALDECEATNSQMARLKMEKG